MLKDKDQRRRLAHEAFTAKLFTAIHNAIKLNEKTVSIDVDAGNLHAEGFVHILFCDVLVGEHHEAAQEFFGE